MAVAVERHRSQPARRGDAGRADRRAARQPRALRARPGARAGRVSRCHGAVRHAGAAQAARGDARVRRGQHHLERGPRRAGRRQEAGQRRLVAHRRQLHAPALLAHHAVRRDRAEPRRRHAVHQHVRRLRSARARDEGAHRRPAGDPQVPVEPPDQPRLQAARVGDDGDARGDPSAGPHPSRDRAQGALPQRQPHGAGGRPWSAPRATPCSTR